MAKSMIEDARESVPRAPACDCFFINFGSAEGSYDVPMHLHAFWQLELGTVGRFDARIRTRRSRLRPGLAVFVPPGVRHGFAYSPGISYLSLKFHTESGSAEARFLDLRASALLRALEKSLLAAASTHRRMPEVTGCVLAALFSAAYAPKQTADDQSSLLGQVRCYVRSRDGRYVTVGDVASAVGYSASHLSALFRNEAGEPLKTYLDRERGRRAAELVSYSDLSFGRIAYELDFRDLFAFSRFFKRIHGRSPRAFRRAAARQG